MALTLADKWVWDFWFARDADTFHVFYLQADRALGDPALRHWNASIGHAVSRDLRTWTVRPTALAPADAPAWDDFTTWTGSVLRKDALWYLFYTGTSREEHGLVQRIGLATSTDLDHWERHSGNPLLEVEPRWYEPLSPGLWHDQAWRDPWVFADPQGAGYRMVFTARANHGEADARGVIGQARSADLLHWEVLPPLAAGERYGQLEVPQIESIDGRYYLLFSTADEHYAQAFVRHSGIRPVTGVHYMVAERPEGPWRFLEDAFFVGDKAGSHYSGKLIRDADGRWMFMAFRNLDTAGGFIGELSDPMPLTVLPDGRLRVETA